MNNKLVVILLAILIAIPGAYAFELNSNELTRNTCQGNTILFTANVFGNGNFNVNLDGSASSWSTAVPNGFILNNNARTIYVYSTPNNNVAPGKYNLNLIVSNQQETKKIPFTINVENCHNLEIKGEISKEICGGQVISYNYQITNLGNYKETYQLKLQGPEFITLSQDLISLNPKESKNVYAYAGQNSESSMFTVSASNKYGSAEITSNLRVNSCYDFTIGTDKDFVNFCEHSEESITVNVKNTGANKDDYNLEIKGPAWANLEKQNLVLDPQKSENVNIVLSPDYGIQGNFDIELKVNSKEESKTMTIKAQVNKCYDIFLDIQEKEINLCNNAQIPVLIKNTGSFEKEFRLETSEQWASLDNYQVKLKSGEEKTLNLLLNVGNLERQSYDVYIRALALDGSGLSMDDKITIHVLNEVQCHNTEIISENSISVTQGSSATLPLTIKNNGNERLIYEVSITGDGSSFTQLNPSILELEPNSGETIYIYSAPSAEVNPGDYNADVRVSYNNNLLASKNININVKQSEFEKEDYIPFTLKILNFFKNLFPKRIANETVFVEEPKVEEPKIEEPKVEEPVKNITQETNKTSYSIGKLYDKVKPYWIYIVVGIIIIIILIFIFSTGEEEEEEEFEEEEVESKKKVKKGGEEKPLKIGRWILGIIVILALIYAQMNYNLLNYAKKYAIILWNYVILYKFYVLIALILLLIIILIIKYWSSILEFFEEEEKPKRRKKKK